MALNYLFHTKIQFRPCRLKYISGNFVIMGFCTSCGTRNDDNSAFCANCGTSMTSGPAKPGPAMQSQPSSYQPSSYQPFGGGNQYQPGGYYNQGYQRYGGGYSGGRTSWLSFVIVLQWITVVILAIFGLILLDRFSSASNDQYYYEAQLFRTIGFLLLGMAVVYAILTIQLAKYSNFARIITIILNILSLIGTLASGIGAVLSALTIYALAFHEETKQLFVSPKYY